MRYIRKLIYICLIYCLALAPLVSYSKEPARPLKSYGSMVYKSTKPVVQKTGKVVVNSSMALAASVFMITIFSAIERAKVGGGSELDIENGSISASAKELLSQNLDFLLDGEILFSIIGSSLITSGALKAGSFFHKKFKSEVKKNDSVVRKYLKSGLISTVAIFSWQFSAELFKIASLELPENEKKYADSLGMYLVELSKGTLSSIEREEAKRAISNLFANMINLLLGNSELTSVLFYNTIRRGLSSEVVVMSLATAFGTMIGTSFPIVGNTLGTILGLGLGIGYAVLPYRNKIHVEKAFAGSKIMLSRSKIDMQFYRLKVFVKNEYKKGLGRKGSYFGFKTLDRNLPRTESLVKKKLLEFKTRRQRYLDSLLARIFNLNSLYQEVVAEANRNKDKASEYDYLTSPDYIFGQLKLTLMETRDIYNDIFSEYIDFRSSSLEDVTNLLEKNDQYTALEKQEFIQRFENLFNDDFFMISQVVDKFDVLVELTNDEINRDAIINVFVEIYMTYFTEETFIQL